MVGESGCRGDGGPEVAMTGCKSVHSVRPPVANAASERLEPVTRSRVKVAGTRRRRSARDARLLHGEIVHDPSHAGNRSGDFGGPCPNVVAVHDTAELDNVLAGRDTDIEGLQT